MKIINITDNICYFMTLHQKFLNNFGRHKRHVLNILADILQEITRTGIVHIWQLLLFNI